MPHPFVLVHRDKGKKGRRKTCERRRAAKKPCVTARSRQSKILRRLKTNPRSLIPTGLLASMSESGQSQPQHGQAVWLNPVRTDVGRCAKPWPTVYSASSGHGTMVDFTVFIAIASATARPMPSVENGYGVCISSQGYLSRVRYSMSTRGGRVVP